MSFKGDVDVCHCSWRCKSCGLMPNECQIGWRSQTRPQRHGRFPRVSSGCGHVSVHQENLHRVPTDSHMVCILVISAIAMHTGPEHIALSGMLGHGMQVSVLLQICGPAAAKPSTSWHMT